MNIAYLAPEIPALSATFVYNEILEVEKNGIRVTPISVHKPGSPALEPQARDLASRTLYLYATPWPGLVINAVFMLLKNPVQFMTTLSLAMGDAVKTGLLTRTGLGIVFRFFAASTLSRMLLENRCTHIHAHFAHIPTDIAMYASLLTDIPYSFTAHANDIFVRGWLLEEKVRRSAFALAISGFNRDFLAAHGAPVDKIHVIHCGVDPDSFVCRAPSTIHQPVTMGSLGRFVEKKGFDVLLHTCRVLENSGMPFILELAGDGPLRKDLMDRARSLGIQDSVKFLGPLPHDQVPDWIRGLDLFVLACRKDSEGDMDGIPVVLMEAMLTGVPVVSTRLTGIPELVENLKTGYLADPGDPQGLAAAIEKAVTDDKLRTRIIKEAVIRVSEEFDQTKNARTLAHLFRGRSL